MSSKLNILRCAASAVPAAGLAAAVTSSGDYGLGMQTGDSPAAAVSALLHGNLAAAAHEQPVIGLTSILLRLPFVALASLLGGGPMLRYRLGVFACALIVGLVGIVVARWSSARGRSWPAAAAIVILMVINPFTLGAQLAGHPEELLGGALCVAAVLASSADRPVLAGVMLGLALGCKEWALIALVPVVIACRRERRRMLLAAVAVGAPLALALPLVDPAAFMRASKLIGAHRETYDRSWWWLVSDTHTVLARSRAGAGGSASLTVHLLPLGLTRTQVSWLAPAVAVPIGWLYRRRQGDRDRLDALGLLALLFLLRCTLDPTFSFYYLVPCLIALLAWESLTRPGLPSASLLAMTTFWLTTRFTTFEPAVICNVVATIGLTTYLADAVLRRDHKPAIRLMPAPFRPITDA